MSSPKTGLSEWFETTAGRYLLEWEQKQFDESLPDVFGFHALQLGLPQVPALRSNRMPHQWRAIGADLEGPDALCGPGLQVDLGRLDAASSPALALHSSALPFPACSLDLVVMPHTLEFSDDPHYALREAERVLVPEGRVVISGLNPASLWGWRQRRGRWSQRLGMGELFLPESGAFIAYWRLREWLRLLGFEVESARFGAYRPALADARWLNRFAWMDVLGPRWWPIFGAVYFVVAIKRVPGVRLIEPAWRRAGRRAAASAAVVRRHGGPPVDGAQSVACAPGQAGSAFASANLPPDPLIDQSAAPCYPPDPFRP
jgi:SAM-dependent methyltransferase